MNRTFTSLLAFLLALAACPIRADVDARGELKNAELEQVSSDPTGMDADNTGRIILNTTESKPKFFDGSTWQPMGSGGGGSGGVNYLEDSSFNFESTAGDWEFFDDGAVTAPVDGTGNDAATDGLTCARTTTAAELLHGDGSLKIARTAAAQGQGCSVEIQIPKAYAGRKHPVTFPMDSSFADEDMGTWVYCSTATPALIEVRAQGDDDALMDASPRTYQGSFIAPSDDSLYETTGYITCRAIVMSVVTTATAASMVIDDVEIGPGNRAVGAVNTAWEPYTPSNTQGFGTITENQLEYKIVGDSIFIRGSFICGTVTTDEAQLGLPNGWTVGGNATSRRIIAGDVARDVTTDDVFYPIALSGDTYLNFGEIRGDGTTNPLSPGQGNFLGNNSGKISINAGPIPIAELAGKGVTNYLTDDVVHANARMSVKTDDGQAITAGSYNQMTWDTPSFGSEYLVSNQFVAPASGVYLVAATATLNSNDTLTSGNNELAVFVNGSRESSMGRFPEGATGAAAVGATTVALEAGDLLDIRVFVDSVDTGINLVASSDANKFTVTRIADYSAGSAVGFDLATPTASGLVRAEKQYVGGTDFTIDSDAAGDSFRRSVLIPYQTYDGAWRLKGNISFSHDADAEILVTITGVTFKNVSSFNQAVTTGQTNGRAVVLANTDDIQVDYDATKTGTDLTLDVELESKPTWAD